MSKYFFIKVDFKIRLENHYRKTHHGLFFKFVFCENIYIFILRYGSCFTIAKIDNLTFTAQLNPLWIV